jgi:hypothetical protein
MCSLDLIGSVAVMNHREAAAPWRHSSETQLRGYGEVFLDEVDSYTGGPTQGTHRGGLRAAAGSRAVRSAARFFSKSSVTSIGGSKGWNELGLVQTGMVELVEGQGGASLAQGGLWWCGNGERRS